MNYVVQAKPDEIKEVADGFAKQQQAIEEMQKDIQRSSDRLRQGWIGLGSEAFFTEEEKVVMPAVQRLVDALGQAAQLMHALTDMFGGADNQASQPFNPSKDGAAAAGQAAAQQAAGQAAGAGMGSGGGGAGGFDGAHLGNRLAASGFDSSGVRSYSSPSSLEWPDTSYTSRLSDYTPGDYSNPDYWTPSDWSSSYGGGSGLGSGVGSGGGGGGGGGGTPGSVTGALRAQAVAGFGLAGFASGSTPDVTYSGLGGFGGPGGPRPPDFGLPMAIAAASPFAVMLGKVVKDKT